MTKHSHPSVPALYFHSDEQFASASSESSLDSLPCEMMQHCLSGFCNWGDLAKLANVQSSWKNLVRDAAIHGGHDAQWELAEALLEGTNGLEKNPSLAMRYFKELAGVSVDNDIVNDQSSSEEDIGANSALPLHPTAGDEKPFAPAMRKLAECYLTGVGTSKNNEKGLKWLEAAYEKGDDVDAAHQLALIYEYAEHGVETDVVLAAIWFKKAAERDHLEAMAEIGMCYELGCGIEQDDEQALEWYMKAANKGHVTSKFSVGEAFEEARGVPQSDEEACLWYYRAAIEGDKDAKKALRRLQDIARIVVPGVRGILDA